MNKESTVTFRVEKDLRIKFSETVKREHQPAAQVLREFMRGYVDEAHRRTAGVGSISSSERKRRAEALNGALASVALEGFSVPQEYEVQAQRFINGEIEFSDLTQFVQELALKIANGR